jgi:lipopolysaccharide/colanic/teichoic acid biosynthesis glycosyltransferase
MNGIKENQWWKYLFDVVVASALLILTFPLLTLAAVAVAIDSSGPLFFRHQRVGLNGRLFTMYKIRTMHNKAIEDGPTITCKGDQRITRVGVLLRRWKLDELPQLLNVLKGDMSIVGPRPETPDHLQFYSEAELRILSVRPGLTSRASVAFCEEEALLANVSDPEQRYIKEIMPAKITIDLEYLDRMSLKEDFAILCLTFCKVVLNHT